MNSRDNRIEPTIGAVDIVESEKPVTGSQMKKSSLLITAAVIQSVAGLIWFAATLAVFYPNYIDGAFDSGVPWLFLLFFGLSFLNLLVPLVAIRYQRQLRSAYALSLFSVIFLLIFLRDTPLGLALIAILLITTGMHRVVLRRVNFFR